MIVETNWKKFLTEEVLHECWHTDEDIRMYSQGTMRMSCLKCGIQGYKRTFANRNDSLDLYEEIRRTEDWENFLVFLWPTYQDETKDCCRSDAKTSRGAFIAWLFCLDDGKNYEDRCKMVAEFYGWKEKSMKEIKFRVMIDGKWHYWGFLKLPSGELYFAGIPTSKNEPLTFEELRNKSQQFIGHKDKDGQEIYVGDIVQVTNLKCQLQKAILVGKVFFDFASFGLEILYVKQWEKYNVNPPEKLDRLWFLTILDSKDIKVIGNIDENPELWRKK